MLVGKDLLVARAQIAHALLVRRLDVTVEIGPAEAGKVARGIGTIVSKEEDRVADNVLVGVFDANVSVDSSEIGSRVLFEFLVGIICKDDVWSLGLKIIIRKLELCNFIGGATYSAMGTVLGLVERSHT